MPSGKGGEGGGIASLATNERPHYALVNFMPHPRGGWGNTGDLTNRVVKCPTPGVKLAVKSPGDLTAHLC